MLSVYYDKICIKFASHHLLLYVVYITELYVGTEFSGLHVPKIIEFYPCIQMLPAKCKWLHFSWATLYIIQFNISLLP